MFYFFTSILFLIDLSMLTTARHRTQKPDCWCKKL